ncbi:MAG: hypothetical protein UHN47_05550 [Lachnospiraceae bacterium]|nr:hypothetical protein [Lachnospiraceae bacterium]
MNVKRGHLMIQLTKEELGEAWLEYQQLLNKETDSFRKEVIRENLESFRAQGKISEIPTECMELILDEMVSQVRKNETDYDSDLEYEMAEGLLYILGNILSRMEDTAGLNSKARIIFPTAEEMISTLQNDMDLYNVLTKEYAFKYNTDGAIVVYNISLEEAKELEEKSQNSNGEYWGAFLGVGGTIYDEPLEYCNDKYKLAGWIDVTPKQSR